MPYLSHQLAAISSRHSECVTKKEGTTEYFKAASDFRQKVYAAVQDQVIRKIEAQHLTQRKALETLGQADAVEGHDIKRRRV